MKYFCCDARRLEVIKLSGTANGIEFLEVRDHLEPDPGAAPAHAVRAAAAARSDQRR